MDKNTVSTDTLEDVIISRLKKAGYKITPQRRIIVREMIEQAGYHFHAKSIYQCVKKKNPLIGTATVFRTVKIIEELGLFDDLFPKNYRFKMNMSVISEIVYFLLNGTYYAFLPKGIIKNELENELLKEIKITDFTIPNLLSYATIKQKKNTWLLDYFCN